MTTSNIMNLDTIIVFTYLCVFWDIFFITNGCAPASQSKRLDGSVFKIFKNSYLYTCAAECASDVLCKSFNFNIINGICELNVADETEYPGNLRPSSEYLYSPIGDWGNVPLGPCQTAACGKSRACKVLRNGQAVCGDSSMVNVAKNKPVSASSTYDISAETAVDGNRDTNYFGWSCTASANSDSSPWWQVDLERNYFILETAIVNRLDALPERLHSLSIEVYVNNPEDDPAAEKQICVEYPGTYTGEELKLNCTTPLIGRYVRIQKTKKNSLSDLLQFCEVDVFVMELEV